MWGGEVHVVATGVLRRMPAAAPRRPRLDLETHRNGAPAAAFQGPARQTSVRKAVTRLSPTDATVAVDDSTGRPGWLEAIRSRKTTGDERLTKNAEKNAMSIHFVFHPQIVRSDVAEDASFDETFTVARLYAAEGKTRRDLSHLIDRSYPYGSLRELRWHLAERFDVPVKGVEVRAA